MRKSGASILVLIFLLAGCAGRGRHAARPGAGSSIDDPAAGYVRHDWTEVREIPDADRRGILLGPLFIGDHRSQLGAVVLRLEIWHPARVDLDLWLGYDADGNGDPETRVPVEFHRSRSCFWAREVRACPRTVEGTYIFCDAGNVDGLFEPFRSLPSGGAFYLSVADTLVKDTGCVQGWSVYLKDSSLQVSEPMRPDISPSP